MPEAEPQFPQSMLEAVSFAARAHQGQLRKDGKTPYLSHVFRVCLVLRDLFDIHDDKALTAALLHDTIEDTTTDFDDLEENFGGEIAGWVAALSKDKRRPEPEREDAYVEQLQNAPWQVQVCKLADIYDNLSDLGSSSPEKWSRTFKNAHRYLDGLKANLAEQAREPWNLVSELLATMEAGETGRSGGA
ncbi:MAG: bifunctional (p)ppGpp synthetase/guanosine-3',5'-bis(diphosphate) 3'-pyrophosphohydrolase [Planctomycetes bacterium]|nr:bifunctional (p)ppGpp synthetase/guanosine-3',5'-bis(diphosphate) 3'-pyrophosphohydrolase [Planctomycetota bacterium]